MKLTNALFSDISTFIERGKKGISQDDVDNLNDYIIDIIINGLELFHKRLVMLGHKNDDLILVRVEYSLVLFKNAKQKFKYLNEQSIIHKTVEEDRIADIEKEVVKLSKESTESLKAAFIYFSDIFEDLWL